MNNSSLFSSISIEYSIFDRFFFLKILNQSHFQLTQIVCLVSNLRLSGNPSKYQQSKVNRRSKAMAGVKGEPMS